MAKKNGKRYSDTERAAIIADMQANGLTQAATAKKHGVSAVTIWQWKRAAKTPARARARPASSLDGLNAMLRAEVQTRVRDILPGIIEDEVARALKATY